MTRRIVLAETLGYCFGVRRAVQMVADSQAAGGPVATLGPIIHNTQKVEELAAAGVRVVDAPAEMENGTLVVRAHGIPVDVAAEACAQDITIVDGTCPYVTNLQQQAREMREAGYRIILMADPTHPETIGVLSHVEGDAVVCKTVAELPRFGPKDRVAVLAQTTLRTDVFVAAVEAVARTAHEVRAFNTICFETVDRQEAARALATDVQAVVVIGGRTSKNTEHLAQICRAAGAKTVKVESAADLDSAFFAGIERIGVTAGASTPDEQIAAVLAWLEALDADG